VVQRLGGGDRHPHLGRCIRQVAGDEGFVRADGWHEMGKSDLARMADGRMDPTGAADTRRTMG
jgi:hypothetical protein